MKNACISGMCALFVVLTVAIPLADGIGIIDFHADTHETVIVDDARWTGAIDRLLAEQPQRLDVRISLAESIRPSNLRDTVKLLANDIGCRFVEDHGNFKARDFLVSTLESYGYNGADGSLHVQDFTYQIKTYTEEWVQVKVEIKPDSSSQSGGGSGSGGTSGSLSSGSSTGSSTSGTNKKKKYKWEWQKVQKEVVFDYAAKNVIAIIPAQSKAEENDPAPEIIIISCHYDTVEKTPGAIDNGSGVASTLEIARVMKEARSRHNYELRFCFFSAEEQGVYGSTAYLTALSEEERGRIVGAINLDMTAHSSDENAQVFTVSTFGARTEDGYKNGTMEAPLENVVSLASRRAFEREKTSDEFYYLINWDKNDLRSFDRKGIDCITISWREIDAERATNRFNIAAPEVMHTENDTFEGLDLESLTVTTRVAIRTFEELYDELEFGSSLARLRDGETDSTKSGDWDGSY
ncbi:MAG: M28 family metallopeptidase [Oscillospiraceae bacterium]